jgi:hypothetical protein
VARRRKLDPIKGQIWFVKRKDGDNGHRWIPITSIDGLCHVAARDHRDYGSNDEPEFGPMIEVTYQWNGKGPEKKMQAPEWAKIAVWKKGATRPTVATVWWSEIYPNIDFSPTVREKPRLMLGKCALAQAIRRSYPDTGGLYIPEEFQGRPEFTDTGREIVYQEAEQKLPESDNPHLQKFLEREKEELSKLTNAQKEVLVTKLAQSPEVKHEAPPAQGGDGSLEPTAPVPCLFVQLEPNRYEIMGRENLIPDLRNILRPYWFPTGKQVLVNDEQLDALKFEFEKHGIKIRPLEKMNG